MFRDVSEFDPGPVPDFELTGTGLGLKMGTGLGLSSDTSLKLLIIEKYKILLDIKNFFGKIYTSDISEFAIQ